MADADDQHEMPSGAARSWKPLSPRGRLQWPSPPSPLRATSKPRLLQSRRLPIATWRLPWD